jgi:hypothetical protein
LSDREGDEERETPVMRPLVWLSNARSNLQAFPTGAQKLVDEIDQAAVRRGKGDGET